MTLENMKKYILLDNTGEKFIITDKIRKYIKDGVNNTDKISEKKNIILTDKIVS